MGIVYVPLIVLIIFRAGRLRGLTEAEDNMALRDLCFDTLKEQIYNKIEVILYYGTKTNLCLPPGLTIRQVENQLHQDSESLVQLLTILNNLTVTRGAKCGIYPGYSLYFIIYYINFAIFMITISCGMDHNKSLLLGQLLIKWQSISSIIDKVQRKPPIVVK